MTFHAPKGGNLMSRRCRNADFHWCEAMKSGCPPPSSARSPAHRSGKSAVYFVLPCYSALHRLRPDPRLSLIASCATGRCRKAGWRARQPSHRPMPPSGRSAQRLGAGELDVLLVSPRRLVNPTSASPAHKADGHGHRRSPLHLGWGHVFAPITDASMLCPTVYDPSTLRQRRPLGYVVQDGRADCPSADVFILRGPLAEISATPAYSICLTGQRLARPAPQ